MWRSAFQLAVDLLCIVKPWPAIVNYILVDMANVCIWILLFAVSERYGIKRKQANQRSYSISAATKTA